MTRNERIGLFRLFCYLLLYCLGLLVWRAVGRLLHPGPAVPLTGLAGPKKEIFLPIPMAEQQLAESRERGSQGRGIAGTNRRVNRSDDVAVLFTERAGWVYERGEAHTR